MPDLTPRQIEILQHALGLSIRNDKPYRNYYAVYTGSDAVQDLEALTKTGLMANGGASPVNGDMVYYYVTDAGQEVAFKHLPKDTRTQKQKRLVPLSRPKVRME